MTNDLTWVEKTQSLWPEDPAVKAVEDNPGWRLIDVGRDFAGRTILTYGWPWPGTQSCDCYTVCERPDSCPKIS